MQTPSLNLSSEVEHLCALSADWPRQVVEAWLNEQHGNLGSVDIRQVKQPDAGLKQRISVRVYLSRCKLPPWFKPYEHFALSILDAEYPDQLRIISDPPPGAVLHRKTECPRPADGGSSRGAPLNKKGSVYGFRIGQASC